MFLRNKIFLALTVVLVGALGFASGFVACLHSKSTSPASLREQSLAQPGSAPPVLRAAVLDKLRVLQRGYSLRDVSRAASLAQELFPADGDVLMLGTEGGKEEWVRGASNDVGFITADWQNWGDVRLDVEHAIVWSSGDVAWVATIGEVRWQKRERPLRCTAILTREQKGWVFRQMHFQWDDNDPVKGDLLRPDTYVRLLSGIRR
ncbi:MAG: nuclear transport factor 2 family protein [Terracidiphilus sp.]